ncbi:MAG: site-specific integrase [Burkholderiales bacterium]|nr:tyrosine-type recombinase/integrase [Gemmatimonadaceae bacterium]MCZ2135408.1 site-specific integrase [Burkholderiales bacterium]
MINLKTPTTSFSVEELSRRARELLMSLNYSPDALKQYEYVWRCLRAYAQKHGLPDMFSEELVDKFLAHRGARPTAAEGKTFHRHLRRATTVLGEVAVHGSVSRRMSMRARSCLPIALQDALNKFLDYSARHLGSRERTRRIHRQHLDAFLVYAHQQGVDSVAEITAGHISGFIRTRSHYAMKTTALTVTTLRSFLRVGFAQGWLPADLSAALPSIHVRPDAKIPSIWAEEQVAALLAAVDVASPIGKRDRAILLLACRLGMRAGDIRALTLDAIKWPAGTIAFAQQKTGALAELPMSDEIATALIDYLQHGRPKTSRREVFLRNNAPYTPFGANNNLYDVITRYRRLAGIELPSTSRRGLHSLRHTLATRMLARGIPFETIGAVLGHRSLDATRRYTKVDIDALRSAALDLPEATL